MNKYLIIDNNKQYRNTVVLTDTKNNALSEGASRLKEVSREPEEESGVVEPVTENK